MLIDKGYSEGDVVSFKLVNGDEIIAKIVSEVVEGGRTSWKISKPCTIIPSPQGLGLVQSMFSAELNKTIELKAEHVMMHAEALQQMRDHYITTTTGIQTVSKGPIIT